MKPHIYTFKWSPHNSNEVFVGTIDATGKELAYKAAMADTRLKGCTIFKSSFRRSDTAKGPDRAGGLDSNGKQINARTLKKLGDFQKNEYQKFLKHLDLAIESLYNCNMDNNAAVLSMPIKQLYNEMKDYHPFK
jgi:hypothetical protein